MLLGVYFDFAQIFCYFNGKLKTPKARQGREADKVWMDLIYQDVPTEHKLA